MASEVFSADIRNQIDEHGFPRTNYPEMAKRLFREAKLNECIEKDYMVAIKMPLGGLYRTYGQEAGLVRAIVEEVKEAGGVPFVTETYGWHHTLSWSKGSVGILTDIVRKGYSQLSLGAPLIIADGLKSIYKETVKIDGLVLKEVDVAGDIYHADAMIVFSHLTGHPNTGYAGALKNVALGCVSRSGKMFIHSGGDMQVEWNEEKCTLCLRCLKACASLAISHQKKSKEKIVIDRAKCIGCGDCILVCPPGALSLKTIRPHPEELASLYKGKLASVVSEIVQIKMADSAKGVLSTFKEGKVGFITNATDITYECDCSTNVTIPIITDVGLLASRDIVAIDKAAIDLAIQRTWAYPGGLADIKLTEKSPGVDKLGQVYRSQFPKEIYSADFWRIIIEAAEKNGLGTRDYELREL